MPCSPELAPVFPDPFEFTPGPFLLPSAPLTPTEFVEEFVDVPGELSAASAGAIPSSVATAQAVMSFFMAFPSFFLIADGKCAWQCRRSEKKSSEIDHITCYRRNVSTGARRDRETRRRKMAKAPKEALCRR